MEKAGRGTCLESRLFKKGIYIYIRGKALNPSMKEAVITCFGMF